LAPKATPLMATQRCASGDNAHTAASAPAWRTGWMGMGRRPPGEDTTVSAQRADAGQHHAVAAMDTSGILPLKPLAKGAIRELAGCWRAARRGAKRLQIIQGASLHAGFIFIANMLSCTIFSGGWQALAPGAITETIFFRGSGGMF
jgi:hypothetical protein